MQNSISPFNTMYSAVQDPAEKLARWYTRIPKYFYLISAEVSFSEDIPLDIGMSSGLIWDMVISCDSTDWNLTLFTLPNQIAGAQAEGTDMVTWAHSFVFTTGDVPSEFYKYQYYEMAPIYFHHRDNFLYGSNDTCLYARVNDVDTITTMQIRMVLSHFS